MLKKTIRDVLTATTKLPLSGAAEEVRSDIFVSLAMAHFRLTTDRSKSRYSGLST